MSEYLQVKVFDNLMGDNITECNDFLKKIGTRVNNLRTEYDLSRDGIICIVTYWS